MVFLPAMMVCRSQREFMFYLAPCCCWMPDIGLRCISRPGDAVPVVGLGSLRSPAEKVWFMQRSGPLQKLPARRDGIAGPNVWLLLKICASREALAGCKRKVIQTPRH